MRSLYEHRKCQIALMRRLRPEDYVASEFRGNARLFRNAVLAENQIVNQALPAATRPIERRLHKNPRLRPEHLIDLRRALDVMPHRYRLAFEMDGDRKAFYLAMHVLRAASWSVAGWVDAGNEEPGLLISLFMLSFDGKMVEQRMIDLAMIGSHAIARWYQRAFRMEESHLLDALRPIGFADINTTRIPCRDGEWRRL
jgi:hypothetical protein